MDGWRGMLLDDIPNWEGNPKLGCISYWAHGARFLIAKKLYTIKYNAYLFYAYLWFKGSRESN